MSEDDLRWMSHALALAEKGRGGASPNPLVGCVVVRGGRLVGEGYHARFGGPHAEVEALRRAGTRSRGATLYVNLEPCSHWGKTPPCADAVIRAGVRRVVAAMPDPNPLVRGRGLRRLKAAGLRVEAGLLRKEAQELNRAFVKFVTRRKAYVILKAAASLDGKIATAAGESRWITSRAARDFSRALRTEVDAILVGAETVRRDDPGLTSHGKGRDPVRVILSRSGKLPPRSQVLRDAGNTWVFHGAKNLKPAARAGKEWVYLKPQGARIPFEAVLAELGRRGISKLLVEGGGETAWSALASGETDEALFFLAPLLLGGREAKGAVGGPGVRKLTRAFRLKSWSAEPVGTDILVRGRF